MEVNKGGPPGGLGRNVVGVGFASFFTDFGSEMATPLLPIFLRKELQATQAALGIIEGIADSAASLLRLVSGWASDRLGRRKAFIFLGYGVAAVMRPLVGLAAAAWHLGLIRFVDRVGKAVRLAPRDALIADSCEPSVRGKAFGFQRAMDNLGGVLGMLLAAVLLSAWSDYRAIFLLTAVPAVCVLFVIAFVLRDVPSKAPPAKFRLTLAPFGREFRWFLLTVAVFTLGNSSDLFILWRLSELGLEDRWVLLVWCGHTVVRMAAALPAGALADRLGRRPLVLAGWLVYAAVYAGLGLTSSLPAALVLVGLYGLYWSLAESLLRAMVADLVPAELRGTAYGMYWFTVGIAVLPASLVFGFLWKAFGPVPPFLTGAALAAAASAMLLGVRRGNGERP
jgi:MFS family permease